MPSNHSSSVSFTSRANACRCFTAAGHDLPQAGVLGLLQPRDDGVGQGVFVELAHGCLLGSQVYYQTQAVRLVTFRIGTGREARASAPGALIEGGR